MLSYMLTIFVNSEILQNFSKTKLLDYSYTEVDRFYDTWKKLIIYTTEIFDKILRLYTCYT